MTAHVRVLSPSVRVLMALQSETWMLALGALAALGGNPVKRNRAKALRMTIPPRPKHAKLYSVSGSKDPKKLLRCCCTVVLKLCCKSYFASFVLLHDMVFLGLSCILLHVLYNSVACLVRLLRAASWYVMSKHVFFASRFVATACRMRPTGLRAYD